MAPEAIAAELDRRGLGAAPPPAAIQLDAADEGRAAVLFLALETQWRTGGMAAAFTGLDYAAIEPTARLAGIALDPRLFLDLRTMEHEALKAFAERARAEAAKR